MATNSLRPPVTGTGVYVRELVTAFLAEPRINRVYGLRDGRVHRIDRVPAAEQPGAAGGHALPRRVGRKARRAWHQVAGRYALRWLAPTVYHEPTYLPVRYPGPTVVTIHDLSHWHYPAYHPASRVIALNRGLPKAVERAAAVITVSEYVADEVRRSFDVAPERVHTVYNGVSPVFRPRAASATRPTLAAYGLEPGGYILSVATLEPRKNLQRLMAAYEALPAAIQDRYPLVLTGAAGWRNGGIHERLRRLLARRRARQLGYVPDADLPMLYAGAAAFAYPALYEGFGLPPLEAMASGIPTLTANTSALPEVVGEAAVTVDPHDTAAISQGLQRLIEDGALRQRLRRAGPQRAAGFSWRRAAAQTVDIYERVRP
ncbi:MAG: glycosyltransferase family 4 protein [Halorhodospira sp.]